jgi:hypothetical protein
MDQIANVKPFLLFYSSSQNYHPNSPKRGSALLGFATHHFTGIWLEMWVFFKHCAYFYPELLK